MVISLIAVPIMYGSDRQGVQFGPEKLRQKGITKLIKNHKKSLYDLGNLFIPNSSEADKYSHHKRIKYLKEVVEINTNLAHSVFSALSSCTFPLIIGGDHSIGLGTVSGSAKYHKNLAVIWVDAHADINTHQTSPSGNAHGMPLAAALGIGESSMVNTYFPGSKVKPENVFIIGARDLDEGEVKLASKLDLDICTMDQIRKEGLKPVLDEVVNKISSPHIDGVHLSFDIDALDKSLVPGTGTPVENGFTLDEGKLIIKELLSSKKVKSMDLVELNPFLDEDEITADVCMELINCTFESL